MNNPNQRSFAQFSNSNNGEEDIRKETFGKFIKDWFFPFFVLKSFIFFVSLFEIFMYVLSLSYGGIMKNGHALLAPTQPSLSKFGMKVPFFIKNGEVWRFFTFTFLHGSIDHLIFNLLSQLIIGAMIENLTGFFKVFAIYMISSFGGGLFSSLISSNNAVGASVAVFGLLGAYFMYLLINWNKGDGAANNMMSFIMLLIVAMISMSVSALNPVVDHYGHIGGLIYGFFLAPLFIKPEQETDCACCEYRIWRIISIIFVVVFYGGGLLLFFTKNFPQVKF